MNVLSDRERRIVSRAMKTSDGKGYLEVCGKPFLIGHVQNCGGQQLKGNSGRIPYTKPLNIDWLENCFEKTAALGYRTVSIILKWNEIEPKVQGNYDWTLIDHYIDWAEKYDLFLDFAWFGSNSCGGTRLPGYVRGWASWIPEYLNNKDKYFGNGTNRYESDSEVYCPWIPDGGKHHFDAENIFKSERNAISNLFAYLSTKDTSNRTILFQVFNEPNCHSEWFSKKNIWFSLINEMGKTIKESDYVVATRVNLAKDVIDSEMVDLEFIDFVGCDPYFGNLSEIRESLYSGITKIPYIAENYGHLSNTSSLAVISIVHGGYYCTWQLNDHWEDFGMYEKPKDTYTSWEIGVIPDMRESGRDMMNLNKSMNKIASVIATAPVGNIEGFNVETDDPLSDYVSEDKNICGINIDFSCKDGSVGMAVFRENKIYLMSDTADKVKFVLYKKPICVSVGHEDCNANWIETRIPQIQESSDGRYVIECRSQECLRVEIT